MFSPFGFILLKTPSLHVVLFNELFHLVGNELNEVKTPDIYFLKTLRDKKCLCLNILNYSARMYFLLDAFTFPEFRSDVPLMMLDVRVQKHPCQDVFPGRSTVTVKNEELRMSAPCSLDSSSIPSAPPAQIHFL